LRTIPFNLLINAFLISPLFTCKNNSMRLQEQKETTQAADPGRNVKEKLSNAVDQLHTENYIIQYFFLGSKVLLAEKS